MSLAPSPVARLTVAGRAAHFFLQHGLLHAAVDDAAVERAGQLAIDDLQAVADHAVEAQLAATGSAKEWKPPVTSTVWQPRDLSVDTSVRAPGIGRCARRGTGDRGFRKSLRSPRARAGRIRNRVRPAWRAR
jgi:hypothetical protein